MGKTVQSYLHPPLPTEVVSSGCSLFSPDRNISFVLQFYKEKWCGTDHKDASKIREGFQPARSLLKKKEQKCSWRIGLGGDWDWQTERGGRSCFCAGSPSVRLHPVVACPHGGTWTSLTRSDTFTCNKTAGLCPQLHTEVEKPLLTFRGDHFKKDLKKYDHHMADLRKQLASRFASVEKVRPAAQESVYIRDDETITALPRAVHLATKLLLPPPTCWIRAWMDAAFVLIAVERQVEVGGGNMGGQEGDFIPTA